MIEWGVFGHGEATAGMYLAYHQSTLGYYLGNKISESYWPHNPLQNPPTSLELNIDHQFSKVTEVMSGGRLRNVSILDLPRVGAKITEIEISQKSVENSAIQTNFAIYNREKGNLSSAFNQYKQLLGAWEKYMEKIDINDFVMNFTAEMKTNKHLNFTKFIADDMETFLLALAGSFLTATRDPLSRWNETAKLMFENPKNTIYVAKHGVYDKLIIDCAFKNNLLRKKFSHLEADGNCNSFEPTLTTNGFCYSFNNQGPSRSWKSSSVIDTFKNIFTSNDANEKFVGVGTAEGELKKFQHGCAKQLHLSVHST